MNRKSYLFFLFGVSIFFALIQNAWSGCISGNCVNGYGTYEYSDKSGSFTFTGNFKEGKAYGTGDIKFYDQKRQIGETKKILGKELYPSKKKAGHGKCGAILISFFVIAACFWLPLLIGGQRITGYILIVTGGITFGYHVWQSIILRSLYRGACPIVELAWAVISGILLIRSDVTLGTVPTPGLDAKICNDCNGKGKIKTGEKKVYDYETVNRKVPCRNCRNGIETYNAIIPHHPNPNYIHTRSRKCLKCYGKGYNIISEQVRLIPPRIVPVIIDCEKCQKTGYTGEHVKKIIKRNETESDIFVSRVISFLYVLYFFYFIVFSS